MGSKARAVPLRDEMYLQTSIGDGSNLGPHTLYTVVQRGGSGLTYPFSN